MKVFKTELEGCFWMEPVLFRDQRGSFMETFHEADLKRILGRQIDFVQDNQSVSHINVIRGLHYQKGSHAQAKLVRVVKGSVRDVIVDLRKESPTYGKNFVLELSDENRRILFIPKGFAHGFRTLENQTIFCYKCDAYYHPEAESGIRFNDPTLNIDWGGDPSEYMLSEKDLQLPFLADLAK